MAIETPFFSIVIPTYNRLAMLREALVSVDSQTYRDFEIIIADDGSVDETLDWLRAERQDVKVVNSGGKGAGGARNAGIGAARGVYVSLLDSDDLWNPQTLERVHEALMKVPGAELVLIREKRFQDSDGPPIFEPGVEMKIQCYASFLDVATSCDGFAGTSVWGAIRRELFREVGAFYEDRAVNMEDLDWLFLASDRGPIIQISEPALLAYRLHGNQISKDPMQFYRSVERFLDAERQGLYPRYGFRQRRKYISAVSLLPIRNFRKSDVFKLSLALLVRMARSIGWRHTLPMIPHHFLHSAAAYLKSKRHHGN